MFCFGYGYINNVHNVLIYLHILQVFHIINVYVIGAHIVPLLWNNREEYGLEDTAVHEQYDNRIAKRNKFVKMVWTSRTNQVVIIL